MKKLICVKDVETLGKQGGKFMCIEENTLITPAARDAAMSYGVEFTTETRPISEKEPMNAEAPAMGIDSNMIFTVLNALMEKGLLKGVLDSLPVQPYVSEKDKGGLKLVRGSSVKFDKFDTGNPDNQVFYQELISKEDSSMSAGFLTIDRSCFEWELSYEEIDYIIEGTLTVTINGTTYTAYPGDVLFIPSGSKVVWGSPDKVKLFYTTYPANWSDLMQG